MLFNISKFIIARPIKTVMLSLLVIILLAVGISNVEMATGNETLVDPKTSVFQNNEMLEKEFGGESIIVLYEGEGLNDLFALETLENIKELEQQLNPLNSIFSIISPVTLIENIAEKQSQKLSKNTSAPSIPTEQETLDRMIYEDGQLREIFDDVVINDTYMMMIIKFAAVADDTEKSEIVSLINDYLNDYSLDSIETIVSGKPVLNIAIRTSMRDSMKKMMMLSIVFMIIVLSLVFKVQWRILPLFIILVAVIGTVGLMGWISIPITMVSMAVFPILIGLGIDYAIQFQNRYIEEMEESGDLNEEQNI